MAAKPPQVDGQPFDLERRRRDDELMRRVIGLQVTILLGILTIVGELAATKFL